MLNVRNLETVKLLLLRKVKKQLFAAFAKKRSKVCHKILKHQETVKFSILKKDPIYFKKLRVVLDEM